LTPRWHWCSGTSVCLITTDFYLYLLYLILYLFLSVYLFDVTVCISYFILVVLEFTF